MVVGSVVGDGGSNVVESVQSAVTTAVEAARKVTTRVEGHANSKVHVVGTGHSVVAVVLGVLKTISD